MAELLCGLRHSPFSRSSIEADGRLASILLFGRDRGGHTYSRCRKLFSLARLVLKHEGGTTKPYLTFKAGRGSLTLLNTESTDSRQICLYFSGAVALHFRGICRCLHPISSLLLTLAFPRHLRTWLRLDSESGANDLSK
jgi:hypothetical protein